MRHHYLTLALAAALPGVGTFSVATAAAQQPGGAENIESYYLSGYLLVQQAESLETQGNLTGAFFKLQEASRIFDSVARSHPNWQTNMVSYRRNIVLRKMDEIRSKERGRTGQTGDGGGTAPSPLPPMDGSFAPSSPGTTIRPATPSGVMDASRAASQQQLQDIDARNQDLRRQLQAREEELYKAKQELLTARAERNKAMEAQITLKNKLDASSGIRGRELEDLKKQLAETTAALEKATALEDKAAEARSELETTLAKSLETIAQLQKEKEQLVAERTQMQALIDGKIGSDSLAEENQRLQRQLEEAKAKISELSKDKEAAAKEIASLRDQMTKMADELNRTKKENQEYRGQIAGLRTQLEETRAKLLASPSTAKNDSELAEENAALRNMVLDQLKNQAFREEKKRLALEQLAKLQISNEDLLNTIEQLAAPPPALSSAETQRVQDPVITDFVNNQGVSGTIVARASGDGPLPADGSGAGPLPVQTRQDLSPDLQTVADAGLAAYRSSRPSEAERAFRTIVQNEPRNVYALSNLAVAQVALNKLPDAEKNLKKALAYSDGDSFSLYLLGVVNYRLNQYEDARQNLLNCIQLDPRNARAHFQLGLTHNRLGDLERARAEFSSAVIIDPTFANAHFNLALIQARTGEFAAAAESYRLALENGADRDAELEKELDKHLR